MMFSSEISVGSQDFEVMFDELCRRKIQSDYILKKPSRKLSIYFEIKGRHIN